MTRALLAQHSADKLVKICGLLGSDHEGERASAAAKADALVRSHGLTWADVISPPITPGASRIRAWRADDPHWRDLLAFCASRMTSLNSRECEFLRSIARRRGDLTERQRDWLEHIAAKLAEAA
jgi:hypothetical protein